MKQYVCVICGTTSEISCNFNTQSISVLVCPAHFAVLYEYYVALVKQYNPDGQNTTAPAQIDELLNEKITMLKSEY